MMVKVDRWRLWVAAIGMMTLPVLAQADSLEAQRQRYQQVELAWDAQQMDVVAQLLPTLRDYPLYPYLEYRQLSQDLSQVSPDQINAFIQANPTLPPARSLPARCNYYYAKWATGKPQEAWDGARDIWLNGHSLPDSCNKLFGVWDQAGERSPLAILKRIRMAMKEGNTGLVNYLSKQLPAEY